MQGARSPNPKKVPCPKSWGIIAGAVGPFATFRFLPHRTRSEGFFAAVARKSEDALDLVLTPKSRKSMFSVADHTVVAELSRWVEEPSLMKFMSVGDTYYGYHIAQADAIKMLAESLSVVCSGVEMGRIYRGRLKPEHALAMYAGLNREAVHCTELQGERVLEYLRCGTVPVDGFYEDMNLVTCNGLATGFAKRIGHRINVLYPNSLRIVNK